MILLNIFEFSFYMKLLMIILTVLAWQKNLQMAATLMHFKSHLLCKIFTQPEQLTTPVFEI